jgi:uncharacterized lipoprotein YmbA
MRALSFLAVVVLSLTGCATGQSQRTTVVSPGGERTTYEATQRGLWFTTGRVEPLVVERDPLEITDKK